MNGQLAGAGGVFENETIRSGVVGTINGALTQRIRMEVYNEGEIDWSNLPLDAFGNAIGNSVVEGMAASSQQQTARNRRETYVDPDTGDHSQFADKPVTRTAESEAMAQAIHAMSADAPDRNKVDPLDGLALAYNTGIRKAPWENEGDIVPDTLLGPNRHYVVRDGYYHLDEPVVMEPVVITANRNALLEAEAAQQIAEDRTVAGAIGSCTKAEADQEAYLRYLAAREQAPEMRAWDPAATRAAEQQRQNLGIYLGLNAVSPFGGLGANYGLLVSGGDVGYAAQVGQTTAILDAFAPSGQVRNANGYAASISRSRTAGLSFEDALVLRGDASRARIVQAIGEAAQPSIEALLKLDPNARVGFRGSLASGLKGPHKLGENMERVPFNGEVAYKLNPKTGRYEPYAGPQGYDADFFVVSDRLAEQLGNSRRFMDAARLDRSLQPVFDSFGAAMQANPALSGMKPGSVTFRVWSEDAMARKIVAGDSPYFFLSPKQPK
jgi:hypothetical protein